MANATTTQTEETTMTTTKFLGITMSWTSAAMANAEEAGMTQSEIEADITRLRDGDVSREALLAQCLDGADADRVTGWNEYVDAVVAAAEAANA